MGRLQAELLWESFREGLYRLKSRVDSTIYYSGLIYTAFYLDMMNTALCGLSQTDPSSLAILESLDKFGDHSPLFGTLKRGEQKHPCMYRRSFRIGIDEPKPTRLDRSIELMESMYGKENKEEVLLYLRDTITWSSLTLTDRNVHPMDGSTNVICLYLLPAT